MSTQLQPPTSRPTAPPDPPRATRSTSRHRGLWIGLAVLIAIVMLVVGASVVAAASFAGRDSSSTTQSFDTTAIESLDVTTVAGDVRILVEERDDIAVTSRSSSTRWSEPVSTAELSEGSLVIASRCESRLFGLRCAASHTVAVPSDVAFDLELETTAGDIQVDGFTGGSASLETTAGDITFDALRAPDQLDALTTAGDIRILVPDETYRVTTDTTVGGSEVQVRQDRDADRLITAETTAGRIRIAHP